MRNLIDFDKLMEQYDFYNDFAVHDLRYLKKECLPFVDAIPVEWIKGWYKRVLSKSGFMGDEMVSIDDLLSDWEKENEN